MGGVERLVSNGSRNGSKEPLGDLHTTDRTQEPFSGPVMQRLDEAGMGGIYCNGMEPTHGIPETLEEKEAAVRRTVKAISILIDPNFGQETADGIHQNAAFWLAHGEITEGHFLILNTFYNLKTQGPNWRPGEVQAVYQRFGNGNGRKQE